MLTEYIGNVSLVEPGQVFVIGGKTVDAASRWQHQQITAFDSTTKTPFCSLLYFTRLDLNLMCGRKATDNVALRISMRFRDELVVRNTRELEEWGEGEISQNLMHANVKNPIVAGEKFKIYILMDDTKFHIAFNNEAYCTYNYRVPVEDIRTIKLDYDVQEVTQVDHRTVYPSPMPVLQHEEPRMVFSNNVPRLFRPGELKRAYAYSEVAIDRSTYLVLGHVIVITGIPYGNPKGWFFIRFTEGASNKQAYHISVRFDPHFLVVRNSMNDNSVYVFHPHHTIIECN